jgi:hypothetical protein
VIPVYNYVQTHLKTGAAIKIKIVTINKSEKFALIFLHDSLVRKTVQRIHLFDESLGRGGAPFK